MLPSSASEGAMGVSHARPRVTASNAKESPSRRRPPARVHRAHLWRQACGSPRLAPRVEERDGRLLEAQRRLQEERQRSVVLEQHLGRLHLAPGRTASQRSASRSKAGLPTSDSRHNPNVREKKDPSFTQLSSMPVESQMEEMATRLAIQAEENETLKAALDSALRGKEEDFRMYHETLGQVKGVFLKALRQQKEDKR